MTEPPGLILFEGLFLDLPWGRWPMTIHSAGWGLVLNLSAVLLVAIFTRKGTERLHRDRLHDEFAAQAPVDFGGRGARGGKMVAHTDLGLSGPWSGGDPRQYLLQPADLYRR
jgi:hypothetical protein